MEVRKVFVDRLMMKKGFACLTGHHYRYIVQVLRKQVGDRIDLIDGKGYLYTCQIYSVKGKEVFLKVLDAVHRPEEKRAEITLCVSPIKGSRMDWLVEKATELGIERLIPIIFRRTVVRIEEEKSKEKIERWRRIAIEAARQSGRVRVPEILSPCPLRSLDSLIKDINNRWVFYEKESQKRLKEILASYQNGKVCIVVGPEGGIEEQEIEWLKTQGFIPCSLGEHILRTETVPLFVLSILLYELSRP